MILKRLFVAVAIAAILLLQAGTCLSAPASNPQDMQCCKSMSCTAQNPQACCKSTVTPAAANMLPAQHDSLQVPAVAAIEYPRTVDIARWTDSRSVARLRVQQHSPPELYALHSSLLI